MNKLSGLFILVFMVSATLFSACAGIKLYKDEGMTNKTNLRFYYPKTYLLVEKNPGKDVTIKSTILHLPDLNNPVYIKTIRGMGSSDLKIDYENGYIKSFGLISDSKIPETLTGLGGLASALAGFKSEQAAVIDSLNINADKEQAKAEKSEWELYELTIIDRQVTLKKVAISK